MFCKPWIAPSLSLPPPPPVFRSPCHSWFSSLSSSVYLMAEALLQWAQASPFSHLFGLKYLLPLLFRNYTHSSVWYLCLSTFTYFLYVSRELYNQFNQLTTQFSAILTSFCRWGSSPQVWEWLVCSWVVTPGAGPLCVVELKESLNLSLVLICCIIPGRWVI